MSILEVSGLLLYFVGLFLCLGGMYFLINVFSFSSGYMVLGGKGLFVSWSLEQDGISLMQATDF